MSKIKFTVEVEVTDELKDEVIKGIGREVAKLLSEGSTDLKASEVEVGALEPVTGETTPTATEEVTEYQVEELGSPVPRTVREVSLKKRI